MSSDIMNTSSQEYMSTQAPGSCCQQDGAGWVSKHKFGLSSAKSELAANFPFKPYDIQLEFMRELYECVSHGKMGLFESPTGTGENSWPSVLLIDRGWLTRHHDYAHLYVQAKH